mmetsp:Transcript_168/g.306  ORF Transcript_168/g.306 Transcript_168/m.306 type:complete len:125 (-) Transcript_168:38-412(-)
MKHPTVKTTTTLKARSTALNRARELLGVSKSEFDKELDGHQTRVRPVLNLERPGLGTKQQKRDQAKRPQGAAEAKLLTSINNRRLKRARDDRELKYAKHDDSSEDEELVSKASSFTKRKRNTSV